MRPAHLPRNEDDLTAWRVYADALLAQGDRLGEMIGLELGLPPAPNAMELRQFHRAVLRRCRASRFLDVGWCLGHARTVRLADAPFGKLVMRRGLEMPGLHQLTELKQYLRRPVAELVESIESRLDIDAMRPFVRALYAAPATCGQVALELHGEWTDGLVKSLVEKLPPAMKRVRLLHGPAEELVSPRFVELDLRAMGLGVPGLDALARRLEAAPSLRLVLGTMTDVRRVAGLARTRVGLPGDAAWLEPISGQLELMPRVPLWQLQRRHGVITAAGQLNRSVPEVHALPRRPSLMRHPGGKWTAVLADLDVLVDGLAVLPEAIVPLVTGSRVAADGREWVFLEDASLWSSYL